MTDALSENQVLDEQVVVESWRRERLAAMRDQRGAAFTKGQVLQLADGDCDLHEAAALLAAGCTIPIAFAILS